MELWAKMETKYPKAGEGINKVMEEIKEHYTMRNADPEANPFKKRNRHDTITDSRCDMLRELPGHVIYLAVDRNRTLLLFSWPGALDQILGEDFATDASNHLDVFSANIRPPDPDVTRHPLQNRWLQAHPKFDRKKTPGGCSGVHHLGFGTEVGKNAGPVVKRCASRSVVAGVRNDKISKRAASLRDEMMCPQGIFGPLRQAVQLIHGILDPELLAEQWQIIKHYPDQSIATTEEEAYSTWAILHNVRTDSHVDTSDRYKGLALMTSFGPYNGLLPMKH